MQWHKWENNVRFSTQNSLKSAVVCLPQRTDARDRIQQTLSEKLRSYDDWWWISKWLCGYWEHVGWGISQKTSSLQWEAFPDPAAFLCPNPHPSLPSSVHHLVKSLPFLSFGTEARVLSPLLTLWPANHPFIPWLPPFLSPFSQLTPLEKKLSPLLYQLIFFPCVSAVRFPAEECVFVVYSPSETLRVSAKCIGAGLLLSSAHWMPPLLKGLYSSNWLFIHLITA